MQLRFATGGAAEGWACRGLATLVKARTPAAMAGDGITRCSTGNDQANAPMLAVTDRLGCRPAAPTWSARRTPGWSDLSRP